MENNNTGLTEVPRRETNYQLNQEWHFKEGDVREAFKRIFSPNAEYVLLQTIANQEAVDALPKYVKEREDYNYPWIPRKIQEGERPKYVSGKNACRIMTFDNFLMDACQQAIDKIARKTIGSENYSHYSMVSTQGVHNTDRASAAIFWPEVHIVNAEKQEELKAIIDNISNDESFEVLREIQSPQYHQMAEIETLHELGIAPLVRLPKELRCGAQELSKYIDFLAQMVEIYKWTGPVCHID